MMINEHEHKGINMISTFTYLLNPTTIIRRKFHVYLHFLTYIIWVLRVKRFKFFHDVSFSRHRLHVATREK